MREGARTARDASDGCGLTAPSVADHDLDRQDPSVPDQKFADTFRGDPRPRGLLPKHAQHASAPPRRGGAELTHCGSSETSPGCVVGSSSKRATGALRSPPGTEAYPPCHRRGCRRLVSANFWSGTLAEARAPALRASPSRGAQVYSLSSSLSRRSSISSALAWRTVTTFRSNVHALPRERVVRVEHDRLGRDLDHAHLHRLARLLAPRPSSSASRRRSNRPARSPRPAGTAARHGDDAVGVVLAVGFARRRASPRQLGAVLDAVELLLESGRDLVVAVQVGQDVCRPSRSRRPPLRRCAARTRARRCNRVGSSCFALDRGRRDVCACAGVEASVARLPFDRSRVRYV